MDDIFPPRPLARDATAILLAQVAEAGFPGQLLAHLRKAADIANLGAFYVPDLSQPEPVLSLWAGEMSGYWFNRNARVILSNTDLTDDIVARIRAASPEGLSVERWRPDPDGPLARIYDRDEVIERVTVSSRAGRSGVMSFYLRGQGAGWFRPEEMVALERELPVAHELIGLRHRIVGATALPFSDRARVSGLRTRNAGPFGRLSPREAQVCDRIVAGISVSGTALDLDVSENTVRTLRRRAYEKLGVHSATQLAAMILNATP